MESVPAPAAGAIDRVAPTRQPDDRVVMRQNWNDLLFLHWQAPAEMLRPLVPANLEIDTFEGRAYVGLVPFSMTGVRPIWSPPVPLLSNFHETNVRTYVHFRGANPGVWFFSLDAANAIAVRIARALWKLPYHFANMRLAHVQTANVALTAASAKDPVANDEEPGKTTGKSGAVGSSTCIDYSTRRLWPGPLPAACSVRYEPTGSIAAAAPGTIEHFLVERYILYAGDNERLFSGRVNHPPYPLQSATVHSLTENLLAAAGIIRGDRPPLAHYAHGVHVRVFPLRPVRL